MDKKILTVQDVSCFGQCSLTVALPILSAFGIETAILPTAVLSNHTMFKSWTFADLTEEIPAIDKKWQEADVKFDCITTGYLGSKKQIGYVKQLIENSLAPGGFTVIDPVMADNGKLYVGFDGEFVEEMKNLVAIADVVLPNITEACFLTGIEYREDDQTPEYIKTLTDGLLALGAKRVVLTGVSLEEGMLGVAVSEGGEIEYRFERYLDKKYHGTGDIFSSVFTGAYFTGASITDAAHFAAKAVIESIRNTMGDDSHWYGVKFEKMLPMITDYVRGR